VGSRDLRNRINTSNFNEIAVEIAAVHEPHWFMAKGEGQASVEGEGEEQLFEEVMSSTQLIFVGETW
jgi:hypothetical protein